ncbi:hypothetical protein MK489_01720 [Myxococcota bacterium]|nr:hypothetical protein [Myxococcota bacterium]
MLGSNAEKARRIGAHRRRVASGILFFAMGVGSISNRFSTLVACAALLAAAACSKPPVSDTAYRPAENVLEVVAVLRRHVPDNTYRFEPARDYTGRNVYRSSLLRLESIERVHASALKAGHMDGVIAFSKGRALERIRAFGLAASEYRRAAEAEPSLAIDALGSADLCKGLEAAENLSLDLDEITNRGDGSSLQSDDVDAVVAGFERRLAALEELRAAAGTSHYEFIAHEEIERTDVARARYFEAIRNVIPDGNVRALSELQRVVVRNRESKNSSRHLIALAELYSALASEYVDANPPESMSFDPVRFQELIDSGARLLQVVANRDGSSEKLEASRRLEAFLAFALRVDHDRFTP